MLPATFLNVIGWCVVVFGAVITISLFVVLAMALAWKAVKYSKNWPLLRAGIALRMHGEKWNRELFWGALDHFVDSDTAAWLVCQRVREKYPRSLREHLYQEDA